jgi:hypothetical protein
MAKNPTTTLLQQSLPHAQPVNQERVQLYLRITVVPPVLETPSIVEIPENDNDNNTEDTNQLKDKITLLEAQKTAMQAKFDKDVENLKCGLFRIERFISSDSDFRFYTGFPNYLCFKAFYDYLSHTRAQAKMDSLIGRR